MVTFISVGMTVVKISVAFSLHKTNVMTRYELLWLVSKQLKKYALIAFLSPRIQQEVVFLVTK